MTERTQTLAAGAMAATTSSALATSAWHQVVENGFEVDFLPAEHCIGQMRRIARATLRHWDLTTLTDDATLAISELVTNAIKHAKGKPVGLRVRHSAYELRIEVRDGTRSPARLRSASVADESGRGLLIVAALAKEWGVSPDGTMTWCSLAIPDGARSQALQPEHPARPETSSKDLVSGDQEPGLATAPLRPQKWPSVWPMTTGTLRLTRLRARSILAMSAWAGDQTAASRVVTELVSNAVVHVGTGEVRLLLVISEDEDLSIEVSDPSPEFRDFDKAVVVEKETGLGLVRALGGEVSLGPPPPSGGKTVRARLRPAAATST
ncbi:ATP-binding protein [Streptomyces sp. NBC_00140]|nr:ATP-binding protein [Streptomyces sp. NBC_00140]